MDPSYLPLVREYRALDQKRKTHPLNAHDAKRFKQLRRVLRDEVFGGRDGDERRSSARLATKLRVSFDSTRAFRKAYARDISGGGLMLETEDTLNVGDPIKLLVRIAEEEPLKVRGEVVWAREGKVGVQFKKLTEEATQRIQAIIDKVAEKRAAELNFLNEAQINALLKE